MITAVNVGRFQDALCVIAGPLKSHLLNYYALTSDHTRRLQGVKANGKFSSTAATSDTPIASKEDLQSIVKNAKVTPPLPSHALLVIDEAICFGFYFDLNAPDTAMRFPPPVSSRQM